MMREITMNSVVRSLYKESSLTERRKFRAAATADPVLHEEMRDLKLAWQHLPKVTFSPSRKSLNRILNYSRKNAVETSF